jgi:hypothetical protein
MCCAHSRLLGQILLLNAPGTIKFFWDTALKHLLPTKVTEKIGLVDPAKPADRAVVARWVEPAHLPEDFGGELAGPAPDAIALDRDAARAAAAAAHAAMHATAIGPHTSRAMADAYLDSLRSVGFEPSVRGLDRRALLRTVFDTIDLDHNGHIDMSELEAARARAEARGLPLLLQFISQRRGERKLGYAEFESSMLALARSAEEAGGPTFADANFLSEMQAMLPDIASRDDT